MSILKPHLRWLAVLVAITLALLFGPRLIPYHFDPEKNLLVNPDAEMGPGSADGKEVVKTPGWKTTAPFNVVKYGAPNGYLAKDIPGPTDRGNNYFAGGPNAVTSSAAQEVDLTPSARSIDANVATCVLSGWLGGYAGENDNATVTVEFKDGASAQLGRFSIGPVSAGERKQISSLLFRTAAAPVPVGTKKLVVTMIMNRTQGTDNDGYVDNLSLTIARRSRP